MTVEPSLCGCKRKPHPSAKHLPSICQAIRLSAYRITHLHQLQINYQQLFFHFNSLRIIMQSNQLSQGENDSSELFRPSKRRKFYRKRTNVEDESSSIPSSPPPPPSMTVDELISHHAHLTDTQHLKTDEEPLSVAEILRQRKAALRRKGGIEFTNSRSSTSTTPQTSDALVVKEDDTLADIRSVIERFAPQTGQVCDVADKHMYAFPRPTLCYP